MWKIHDPKVNVYQSPDLHAPTIMELVAGDKVEFVAGLFSGSEVKRGGISWLRVKLPNGQKGYVQENIRIENIGDGTRLCPECHHLNSTDTWTCSECKRNFHPVLFCVPQVKMKKSNTGNWDGQGVISIPRMCSSCCSTVNLHEIPIGSEYSTTTRNLTVSTKITSNVSFTAYICSECLQIVDALEKHRQKNSRIGTIVALYMFAWLTSIVTFVIGALGFIDSLSRGWSILWPASLLLISILLFIGTFIFYRRTRNNQAMNKASKFTEHLKLIELYGHTYQPILIENQVESPGWILKIYSTEYAKIFESSNRNFVQIEN